MLSSILEGSKVAFSVPRLPSPMTDAALTQLMPALCVVGAKGDRLGFVARRRTPRAAAGRT
jgi:hypothetical protein